MTDFSALRIGNLDQLVGALKDEVAGTATQWFNANQATVGGYLTSLAQAAAETTASLAEGRIDQATATIVFANQKAAALQTIQFAEYMTLALAQSLLDGVFSILGWAIFNSTGVNLMPDLVKPAAPA